MKQFTQEQAIKLAKSGWWLDCSDDEIVRLQLYQDRVCMDFGRFHEAVESVLGRPVYTHEFGSASNLIDEYEGERPSPTFDEIIAMLPQDKLIVIEV